MRSTALKGLILAKPEMELHIPATAWTTTGNAGVTEQLLAFDGQSGDATLMQRYEAGACTASAVIRHEYWEEVLILEGTLTDLTLSQTFEAGSYACRPPGMPHGPYLSSAGCLMFVQTRYPSN